MTRILVGVGNPAFYPFLVKYLQPCGFPKIEVHAFAEQSSLLLQLISEC